MTRRIKYYCPYRITYRSPRYGKFVTVPKGYPSDGATGAFDIWSESWWVHDALTDRGTWDDGTPCTNWQASAVIGDILKHEGRRFRAVYWRWFTYGARRLAGHK